MLCRQATRSTFCTTASLEVLFVRAIVLLPSAGRPGRKGRRDITPNDVACALKGPVLRAVSELTVLGASAST